MPRYTKAEEQKIARTWVLLDPEDPHNSNCLCTADRRGPDYPCPACEKAGCEMESERPSHCKLTGDPMPWDHDDRADLNNTEWPCTRC